MSKQEVSILITGPACVGKTTVGVLIEKALRDAGMHVEPFCTKDGDEHHKREWLASGQLDEIVPNIHVTLEERCVRKPLLKSLASEYIEEGE